jgi:hypothetical protein
MLFRVLFKAYTDSLIISARPPTVLWDYWSGVERDPTGYAASSTTPMQ